MKRLFTILFLAVALAVQAGVTNFVAETATGNGSGSDLSNLNSRTNVNNIWPSNSVIALVGTLTNTLTVPSNNVTIWFQPNAQFSAPVIQSGTPFIDVSGRTNITIDGGANGLMQFTDNGTLLDYQVSVFGVRASTDCDHVTVQNLTVTNLYVHPYGTTADGNRYGEAVSLSGSDITVSNCNVSQGDTMISLAWNTGIYSNWTIIGNTIGSCNHGIGLGNNATNAFVNNVTITKNTIDHLDVWDGNSGLHLDGIIIFNEAPDYSGCMSNLTISANLIGPNIGLTNTAAIFMDFYKTNQCSAMKIINNLMTARPPYRWDNGFIAGCDCSAYAVSLIANNTMLSTNSQSIGISGGANCGITNNLLYSVSTAISLVSESGWPPGFGSDYNAFWNINWDNGPFYFPPSQGGAASYALWQGQGYDLHSVTNMPLLNLATGQPMTNDTVVIGAGIALSNLFTTDITGATRSGAWTIGAYQSAYVPPVAALQFMPMIRSN